MKRNSKKLKQFLIVFAVLGLCIPGAYAARSVIDPGDYVIGLPNDGNWPDGEAPHHAIDGDITTKFLHFRHDDPEEVGIVVTLQQPAAADELRLTAANDAPERDPVYYSVYGSNGTIYDGPWTLLGEGPIEEFEEGNWPRFKATVAPLRFANSTEYQHYMVAFTELVGTGLFQIAEIQLIDNGIITEHPAAALVPHGQDAVFGVQVDSPNPVSYQWYKADDNGDIAVGGDQGQLVIANADFEDEGAYYCVVTDTATQQSWTTWPANLVIARLRAHWTMDEADFDGTSYLDVSTEDPTAFDAEVNEPPIFVDGLKGQAVDLDGQSGMAHAGTWNPLEGSNQMTLSLWVNYRGYTDSWQKILAKRTGWASHEHQWQLLAGDNAPFLNFQSQHSQVFVPDVLLDDGQWQHIAVTYDGVTAAVYVDGELRNSGYFGIGSGPDSAFMIASQDPQWREGFTGLLDDIKVYNYAISDLDIAEIYFSESGNKPCLNRPSLDITGDCRVGLADFAQIAAWWLHDGLYTNQ